MKRSLGESSACATIVLLMTRALGRSAPPGSKVPSAYSAGAMRSKFSPALPHSGCKGLFNVPSIVRGVAESICRCSSGSSRERRRNRGAVRGAALRAVDSEAQRYETM